jgi:hydroxymethylpyrimidine/phosphomethylpyrimidine kinase
MLTALTIAGSDSIAGAGIQADLKTFAAHGVYGTCAITAVTAQNTEHVIDVLAMPANLVTAQIHAVLDDLTVQAVKIGMLATGAIAEAVAAILVRRRLPHVVLDTVLQSSSGRPLLDPAGVTVLRESLLPLAEVVTVNRIEAEALTGLPIAGLDEGHRALDRLVHMGARAVVLKGGHFAGPPVDLLYDGRVFTEFDGDRIDSPHTHGTGCTFASAIAARLAIGAPLVEAVRHAKRYVADGIRHAPALGRGHGPLEHFLPLGGGTAE